MKYNKNKTRDLLILAGLKDIETYGIESFSVRRIAASCGVSCATPYKHFQNRDDFVLAILKYINSQWYEIQKRILLQFPADDMMRLIEISIAYVRFLVDNPNFRTIIFQSKESFTQEQIEERANLSECTKMLLNSYCRSMNMPDEARVRKTYTVRALIYGAALMIGNGQLEDSEQTYAMVRQTIEREFTLN
ncbi:MAG: TetR/AcrR family transcriptional regulator [Clostridia bacterium]|nr:TetR/AcrR family transcriptional regulator [Clostridia bacterium]